jgi:hypothetical protein
LITFTFYIDHERAVRDEGL